MRRACAAGTFAWCAPEMLLGRECNEKSDLYSFGVVWPSRLHHAACVIPFECLLKLPQQLCVSLETACAVGTVLFCWGL